MKRASYPGPVVSVLLLALALNICTASAANLTQYWPFNDGGSSTTATNAVAGGNTGNLVDVSWVTSGLPPQLTNATAAISLAGTGGYVDLGNINLLGHGTISLWINPAGYNNDERLFAQVYYDPPYSGSVHFDPYGTGNIQVYDYNADAWMNLAPMSVVPVGSWTHVALVYDYGSVQLWINGVQQTQFPGATSVGDFNTQDFGLGAAFDVVGGYTFGSASYYGLMSDVSIWDGPLSSNSIVQLASGVSPTAIHDALAPGHLVQYWPFQDGSGSATATNLVPGGNIGSLINFNAGTAWVTGNVPPQLAARSTVALGFDGVADYVNLGAITPEGDGTLSLWINPATVTSTNSGLYLFSPLTVPESPLTNAGDIGIDVPPFGTGGVAVYDKAWAAVSLNGALSANTWYHLAFAFSKGQVTLFINGTAQLTAPSRFIFDTAQTGLGAQYDGFLGDTFNGLIDDVSIWDKSLNPATIQLLANGQSPLTVVDTPNQPVQIPLNVVGVETPTPAHLVQYFPLNETNGLTAHNAVAGGNTGYLSNYTGTVSPWESTNLPVPPLTNDISALTFNGVQNYVDLGNIGLSDEATVSLWVNPTVVGPDVRIFSQESGALTLNGAAGFFDVGGIWVWNGATQNWVTLAADGTMVTNQWSHLAFVYTGGTCTLYINGVQQMTGAVGFDFSTNSFGLGDNFLSTYGNLYQGLMDDVSIWDGPLAPTDVQNLAAGISPPALVGAAANLVDYYPLNGTGATQTVSNLVSGASNGQMENYNVSVDLESWETTNLPPALSYATSALFFNGFGDFVNLGNIGLSGAGTVSMWVCPSTLSLSRRLFSPLSGGLLPAGATGFDQGTNEVWVYTGGTGEATVPLGSMGGANFVNQWFHLAFVYGSGLVTLYVNGVQEQTVATGFDFSGADFGLGAELLNAYGNTFSGLMADVSIWDGPVSPTTVQLLAGGTIPSEVVDTPVNLVSTWPTYPSGFTLEEVRSLPAAPGDWQIVTDGTLVQSGLNWVATVPIPAKGAAFFRLVNTGTALTPRGN